MIDDLKLFLAVAASGSFSRAATLSGLAQPAVSKRIAALERRLEAALFERTGRGARLTEAGRALVGRAEALTHAAENLADALAADVMQARGTVRIAIQPSIAWPLVRDLFVRLRTTHPGVRLEVAEAPTGQIAAWLREGRHDIGVLNQPGQELLPNVEPLFAPALLLISRPGDRLTRRRTIRFDSLDGVPLITSVMPNGGRVLLEETARQRGIKLDVVMDVYSIHLIKKLVSEGLAYSISTMTAIQEEVAAGRIGAARIVSPVLAQPFFLSITSTRPPSAAVRIVAQAVREVAAARPAR